MIDLPQADRLGATAGNDESLIQELADAYERVGLAQGFPGHANLGRETEALASMKKAAELRLRLPVTSPERRLALIGTWNRIARRAARS